MLFTGGAGAIGHSLPSSAFPEATTGVCTGRLGTTGEAQLFRTISCTTGAWDSGTRVPLRFKTTGTCWAAGELTLTTEMGASLLCVDSALCETSAGAIDVHINGDFSCSVLTTVLLSGHIFTFASTSPGTSDESKLESVTALDWSTVLVSADSDGGAVKRGRLQTELIASGV